MIRVKQIKVNVLNDNKDVIIKLLSRKLRINVNDIFDYKIVKKSIDARYKPDIFYVYEIDILCKNENSIISRNKNNIDISLSVDEEYIKPLHGDIELCNRPIIVGSGPAGLYSAGQECGEDGSAESDQRPCI